MFSFVFTIFFLIVLEKYFKFKTVTSRWESTLDLLVGLQNPAEDTKEFCSSFKSGFVVGYASSTVSIVIVFVSYCFPSIHLK